MSRQPKLCPKSQIPGFSSAIPEFGATASLSSLEPPLEAAEAKRHHRIFRVKRKHVLKACDRCRVKKTKCDGNQPCNRCSAYNHPCLFRERKATQTKVYSRDFVEMLESHHSLVVKALQRLYKHCINNEGFPGEPLVEVADGHPLTHAILDRLGLIKQAEEGTDEPSENIEESLQYLRHLSTSTDYSGTVDPSPEPTSPSGTSTATFEQPSSSGVDDLWKWELQSIPNDQYGAYHRCDYVDTTSRPETGVAGLAADISYQTSVPLVHAVGSPGMYSPNDTCNEMFRKSRLHAMMIPWPSSYEGAASLPVDMFSEYQVPVQGQSAYPVPDTGIPCGWTFPSV